MRFIFIKPKKGKKMDEKNDLREFEKFRYNDVMELGFTREDLDDSVFEGTNGYRWFTVTMKLAKLKGGERIELHWDCETHLVYISRYSKDSVIITRLVVESGSRLKEIILLFTGEYNMEKACGL